MKILIIAPRYHTNLNYRVKALKEAGHEVLMFVFYKGHSEVYDSIEPIVLGYSSFSQFIKKNCLFFVNKKKRGTYEQILSFFPWSKFKNEYKKIKPDVFIIKGFLGAFVIQSLFISLMYKQKTYLLLQTAKHFPETLLKKIQIFILKKIFRVKGIISPLQNELKERDEFYNYLPFIIETKEFDKEYFKNNRVNIISIGKFVKRKDHLTLLKAIEGVKEKYDIFLTIIGEKVSEEVLDNIKKYIKNKKLEKMVQIKYNLDNKEVLNLYKDNDLFVLPGYDEPAAYSLLEAMASKLPVICSDSNGTKCYIEEGVNGYIFRSKSKENLENCLKKVIGDRERLRTMGEKSHEISKNNFSSNVFINKFNQILDQT
jgi:glycosyltransferase involved in cell wall biosynthesis